MKCDQLDIFKSSQEGRAAAAPKTGLLDAIKNKTFARPVMVSLGMGVDSVVMSIALIQLGCVPDQIGRAHVCTPVTHAQIVRRLLLEKKRKNLFSIEVPEKITSN